MALIVEVTASSCQLAARRPGSRGCVKERASARAALTPVAALPNDGSHAGDCRGAWSPTAWEEKIMAEHPNAVRIRDGYAAFINGDLAVLNDLLTEDVVWHHGGRSRLSGDYHGRDAVFGLFGKLFEVTGGTFHMDLGAGFSH